MRTDPKPDDAWWDPKEKEWVHGAKDAQGRLVGEVRYWNTDGVLISTAEHVDGKPHGVARRYFPTGEIAQDSRYKDGKIDGVRSFLRGAGDVPRPLREAAPNVVAFECVYDDGDLIGTTWRDEHGRETDQHGRPVRKRPPSVEPTAFFLSGQGWFFMRRRGEDGTETIVSREWYETGELREESIYADGSERSFHKNGQLRHEGHRNRTGARHYPIGTWRYYDNKGNLRRVTEYGPNGVEVRRAWHRPKREAKRGPMMREGAVEQDAEVGIWTAGDRTIDLGPRISDAELLAHPSTADVLDDAIPGDDGIPGTLARVRRAGIAGDSALLGLEDTPAWRVVDEDGKLVSIAKSARYGGHLVTALHAVRWSPPDGELLAGVATALFRGDRAQAALDVIDAALLLDDQPAWRTARTAYLRATGRHAEQPSQLDDRARGLLDEIRLHPDDDAPRLVLADHIASTFPEHTALIVAQCGGNPDEAIVAAFLATLPAWLTEYNTPARGFLDDVRYLEAEPFVTADPDLLLRVAPTCRAIELQYASGYIAQLVTLPWLSRYVDLGFTDTYISTIPAQQLARCKHLDQLEHLGLWSTGLDDEALQAICGGTAYPRLQSIDIGHHRDDMSYTIEGVRALGDAAFAKTLVALSMTNRWLGDEVIEVIAKLPALVSLDLTNGSLTDAGARALLELPNAWTSLSLGGSEFGDSMTQALTARFGDRVRFTR